MSEKTKNLTGEPLEWDYTQLKVISTEVNGNGGFTSQGHCLNCDPPRALKGSSVSRPGALRALRERFRDHSKRIHPEKISKTTLTT